MWECGSGKQVWKTSSTSSLGHVNAIQVERNPSLGSGPSDSYEGEYETEDKMLFAATEKSGLCVGVKAIRFV